MADNHTRFVDERFFGTHCRGGLFPGILIAPHGQARQISAAHEYPSILPVPSFFTMGNHHQDCRCPAVHLCGLVQKEYPNRNVCTLSW